MKNIKYILLLIFLILPGIAAGQVMYVPGDYNKIQDAIDAALPGTAIYVGVGEYHENLTLKDNIYLFGKGADATVINGGGKDDVIYGYGVDTVYIEGFSIINSSQGFNYAGIKIENGNFAIVRNCRISDNANGIFMSDSYGFIQNSIISNNGISSDSNTEYGLCLVRGQVEVSNTLVVSNIEEGVYSYQMDTDSLFANNTICYNGSAGIWCYASSPTVTNNIIANNSIGISAIYGAMPSIDYNDVWNNSTSNYDSQTGGYAMAGQNDISDDPLFKASSNGDYRLETNSPCVNAGDPDAQYNDPDSSRNDMGAYGGDNTRTDFDAPASLTNLTAVVQGTTEYVLLSWDMPGDDSWDTSLPSGSMYVIKYASYGINWSIPGPEGTSLSVSTSGVMPGTNISRMITGLSEGVTYYFAIWTSDDDFNWSGISNGTTLWIYTEQTVPPQQYTISGYVTDSDRTGISDVVVAISGDYDAAIYTDSEGYYAFLDLPAGNYTVTVSKSGWEFALPGRNYTPLESDMTNENYVGTIISGSTKPETIEIPIGSGDTPVSVTAPVEGDSKIIMPESAKDRRGVVDPSQGDEVTIIFQSEQEVDDYIGQTFHIRIFNLLGELVEEFEKIPSSADDTWTTWIPGDIASGIYIIHVQGPGVNIHKKIPVLR